MSARAATAGGAGGAGAGDTTGAADAHTASAAAAESKKSGAEYWAPTRAYVVAFTNPDGTERVGPSEQTVIEELRGRGVEVVTRTTEQLLRMDSFATTDLVVGPFNWTKHAARVLGISIPEPPDYPECLKHLLHRRIWKSTLGEAHAAVEAGLPGAAPFDAPQFFIKPATDVKAFSGGVEPKDSMLGYYLADWNPDRLSADLPVWCAETVKFSREYRAYVVRGEMRALCRYIAPEGCEVEGPYDPEVDVDLDLAVVEGAVSTLFASDESREIQGCSLDFGVLVPSATAADGEGKPVTALIEVNEGYSLGKYKGLSGKDYTDLLIARWGQLLKSRPTA